MRICGVTIQARTANLVVLECVDGSYRLCDAIPKIDLSDDVSQEGMRSFYDILQAFVRDNCIDTIFVKARNHSGDYAGGAVGFKIEAMIQLLGVEVVLLRANAIASAVRNMDLAGIDQVYRYQQDAFRVAYAGCKQKC